MLGKDGAQENENLLDESYWSRRFLALSAKIGPFALVALALLLVVFLVPWTDKDDNEGRKRSLPSRYLRNLKIDRARLSMAKGDLASGINTWKALLAESPDDTRLMRLLIDDLGYARSAVLDEFGGAEAFGEKLLHVGRTNRDDLVRLIRLNAGLGNWKEVKTWAVTLGTNKPPEIHGWLARVYLDQGDVMAFEQTWSVFKKDFSKDPDLVPWRLAADALGSEPDRAREALKKLEQLKGNRDKGSMALQMLRLVARATGDAASERRCLEELTAMGSARPLHWIEHMELLARKDRMEEAVALGDRLVEARGRPGDVDEALMRLLALGMNTAAKAFLERSIKDHPLEVEVSILTPIPLLGASEWAACLEAAYALRGQQPTSGMVDPISFFVEGCSFEALGNDRKANSAFFDMEAASTPQPEIVLHFAELTSWLSIISSNSLPQSRVWRLVKALQKPLPNSENYWRIRSVVAGRSDQPIDMVLSARKAAGINPASTEAIANLVRALMLSGTRDAEVLSLCEGLATQVPAEAGWRVMHAALLAATGKPEDARRMLSAIQEPWVPARLLEELKRAWLEVHVRAKDWDNARKTARELELKPMEPLVAKRFNELVSAIPK